MSDEEIPFKPKKRGGRRPGAGRPKGAVSKKKSIDFAMNLIKEGETPLEHMIKVMRAEFPPELKESIKNGELSPEIIKALTGWHNVRFEAAKNAAPYVHPKLTSVEHKGLPKDEEKISDIELARRIAFLLQGHRQDPVPPKVEDEKPEEVMH